MARSASLARWWPSSAALNKQMPAPRTILHIDMNAFFASVEQRNNPELQGRPVAVIGSAGRTVILTASYEARTFGVKTGQTIWEARRLCPQLILAPASNRLYSATSQQIVAILRDYTPQVEVFSIDEAFLDISDSLRLFGPAEQIARQIKERIRGELGLACSIGIAPNKLLAKLASDLQKPDGLVVVLPDQVTGLLENMPVRELCGIGRATARQLALLGIRTCGQLGRFPQELLTRRFGVVGIRLQQMGLGQDNAPVVPEEEAAEVQSVGHSMTFSRDLEDEDALRAKLLQLAEMVGRRARRYGVSGRTVTVTVRYADFSTLSRQQHQTEALALSSDLYYAGLRILSGLNLEQPVRLLGLTLSSLQRANGQLPLFPEQQRRLRATTAMDAVNNRYGDFTVMQGSLLPEQERGSHVISPAWKPEGMRHVTVT